MMRGSGKAAAIVAAFDANPLLNSVELAEMLGERSEYVRTALRRAGRKLSGPRRRGFVRAAAPLGKRTGEKKYMIVLDAINAGAETSDQVAAMTGMTIAIASAHLSRLVKANLVKLIRRGARHFHRRGGASNVYGPMAARAAE